MRSFMTVSRNCVSVFTLGFCLTLQIGLVCSWQTPSDFQQGELVRFLFVHVPSAWMSLLLYVFITLASVCFLVSRYPLFYWCCSLGSQLGALFTCFTLYSGSSWGSQAWGTFWVWDARNTSVLILLCIYCAAIWMVVPEIKALFICFGFVNLPIIHFSVNWWSTLHQPSSLSQFDTSIHVSMLVPLLCLAVCFVCYTSVVVLIEIRRIYLEHLCLFYLGRD